MGDIKAAYITAFATIVAAVITGIFLLFISISENGINVDTPIQQNPDDGERSTNGNGSLPSSPLSKTSGGKDSIENTSAKNLLKTENISFQISNCEQKLIDLTPRIKNSMTSKILLGPSHGELKLKSPNIYEYSPPTTGKFKPIGMSFVLLDEKNAYQSLINVTIDISTHQQMC